MLNVYPHIQHKQKRSPNLSKGDIEIQESRRTHAIARMNEIHSRYRIVHGDFLYQLVLFVHEPIYWINKYGYRQLDELEINVSHVYLYTQRNRQTTRKLHEYLRLNFQIRPYTRCGLISLMV